MCPHCEQLVTGDSTAIGHADLKAVGEPMRPFTGSTPGDIWIINYRCSRCGARWHFHAHPTRPTSGFQGGAYGSTH